jgi:hypothetical protein
LSNLGNYIYYIPRPYRNINKLPIPGPMAKAETETEYAIEAAIIREETLSAKETPTPLRGNKGRSDKEHRFDKFISVNMSAIRDKTISEAEFFIDAVSC